MTFYVFKQINVITVGKQTDIYGSVDATVVTLNLYLLYKEVVCEINKTR